MASNQRNAVISPEGYLPEFWQQLLQLHRLLVWARWLIVGTCCLLFGIPSLWALRSEIAMLRDYFTWPALRYALLFNPIPAVGLALCQALMLSTLIWQSRNSLFGLPLREVKRLERQLEQINRQGPAHPLWPFVHREPY
ncbi:MAG: hypothetical protein AAF289_02545 [Cyanobacteria bacterium P01_A01_bin.135]